MARSRPVTKKSAPPAKAVSPTPEVNKTKARWLAGGGLAGLIIAVLLLQWDFLPPAPVIPVGGFEPILAAQITQAVAQVQAQRGSGKAWGNLAITLQVHELTAEADHCFGWATRLDPREPRWPYLHALLLRERDHPASLALLSQAAHRMTAPVEIVQLRLAEELVEAGRIEEARQHFEQVLRTFPTQPAALVSLAELDRAQNQAAQALDRLQPALLHPTTARRAHLLLAAIERQLGNGEAADQAAGKAATLPPDAPLPDPWLEETVPFRIGRKAWAERAQQLLAQGRHAEVDPILQQLLQHYPDAPEVWLLRGRLHFERHDCQGAEIPLRRHLSLSPDSVNGLAQLGMVLLCLERYAEAVGPLERCLQLKPDFAEAHFNLGFALARSGRGQQAMDAFRQAIRFSPNFLDPHITLADLLIQSGDKAEATTVLDRALQLNPRDERAQELRRRLTGKTP